MLGKFSEGNAKGIKRAPSIFLLRIWEMIDGALYIIIRCGLLLYPTIRSICSGVACGSDWVRKWVSRCRDSSGVRLTAMRSGPKKSSGVQ